MLCQKPGILGWRIHTDCPRLEAITGGVGCEGGDGKVSRWVWGYVYVAVEVVDVYMKVLGKYV